MTDLTSYTVTPINVVPLDDAKCYKALALRLANTIYRQIERTNLDTTPNFLLKPYYINNNVTVSAENYINSVIQEAFYEFFRATERQRWSVDSATESIEKLLYTKGCPEYCNVESMLSEDEDLVDPRIFMNTLISQGELRKIILETLVDVLEAPLSFCLGTPYVD